MMVVVAAAARALGGIAVGVVIIVPVVGFGIYPVWRWPLLQCCCQSGCRRRRRLLLLLMPMPPLGWFDQVLDPLGFDPLSLRSRGAGRHIAVFQRRWLDWGELLLLLLPLLRLFLLWLLMWLFLLWLLHPW